MLNRKQFKLVRKLDNPNFIQDIEIVGDSSDKYFYWASRNGSPVVYKSIELKRTSDFTSKYENLIYTLPFDILSDSEEISIYLDHSIISEYKRYRAQFIMNLLTLVFITVNVLLVGIQIYAIFS